MGTDQGAKPHDITDPAVAPKAHDIEADAEGSPPSTLKGDVLFGLAVASLFALLVLRVVPGLLDGRLVDTDSYMRLVRVRQLLESWSWFDSTVPRSNAPFGETLHWTRPVDVLILLGTAVGAPFSVWSAHYTSRASCCRRFCLSRSAL